MSVVRVKQVAHFLEPTSGKRVNSYLVGVLVACLLATGLIFAATKIDSVSDVVAPLVLIVGGIVLVAAWRNWEFGVQALLVIVVFEGAVRKWFLPSASELVYFYKDFVMGAILIGYLSQRIKPPLLIKGQLNLVYIALTAFVMYAVAVVLNPSAPHLLVGLFGLKAYCLYMPLAFIVPRMLPNKEKLIRFLRWYLIIALSVVFLGMVQFTSTDATSSLNRYAWNPEASESDIEAYGISTFEDSEGSTYARVTGTFSYISGLTIYLPVVFALLLGLTSLSPSRHLPRLFRWLYHVVLAVVTVTAFMTGSRSAIVHLAVIALIFYAFTSLKNLGYRLFQVAFGGALVYVALTMAFPEALDAMKTRALGGEEQIAEGRERIANVFRLPVDEAEYAGALGYGIGATQNSVSSLMSKLDLPFEGDPIPIGYEDESGRVMLDLGVIGYLLYLLLRYSLLITLWRVCLAIRDAESKSLAIAALAVLTIHLFVGGAVVVHTQNVYQWFLIGVCFALLNAERLWHAAAGFNRIHQPASPCGTYRSHQLLKRGETL